MGWRTMPASLSLATTAAAPVPGSIVMMRSADGCSTGWLTSRRTHSANAPAASANKTTSKSRNLNSEKPRSPARRSARAAAGGAINEGKDSIIRLCGTLQSFGSGKEIFKDQQGGELVRACAPRLAVEAALDHHLLGFITGQSLVLHEDLDRKRRAQPFGETQRGCRRIADLAVHSKRQSHDDGFNVEVFDEGL